MGQLLWAVRLSARPGVSNQVAQQRHRAVVGWPSPGGRGRAERKPGQPLERPRSALQEVMPVCSVNEPAHFIPLMIFPFSWSTMLGPSKSLLTASSLQLSLLPTLSVIHHSTDLPAPNTFALSLPQTWGKLALLPRAFHQPHCPPGLLLPILPPLLPIPSVNLSQWSFQDVQAESHNSSPREQQ